MERFFLVYKTVNTIKGEYYIGIHITDDIEDDYLGSGKRLKNSIEKHGRSIFKKEILAIFDNPHDMFKMEADLVNEETLKEHLCLNLKVGGYGSWKLQDSTILYTSEHQAKRSPFNKKDWREKNADKIVEWTRRGNQRAKISLNEKRSLGWKPKGCLGYHHTEEHKQKMSSIMSESQSGEKNSNFGKKWIFSLDEKKSMPVSNEDINTWLDKGWQIGRKMKFN